MVCPNCGRKIPDESFVCKECGVRIKRAEKADDFAEMPPQDDLYDVAQSASPVNASPSGMRRKKIMAALAAALAVAAVLVFVLTRKPVVDLNKYMVISYEGENGSGTAYAKLDYDAFYEAYAGKLELNKDAICEVAGLSDEVWGRMLNASVVDQVDLTAPATDDQAANLMYLTFSLFDIYRLDKTEGLSNGDIIRNTYQFGDTDTEMFEKGFCCKIRLRPEEHVVFGLNES